MVHVLVFTGGCGAPLTVWYSSPDRGPDAGGRRHRGLLLHIWQSRSSSCKSSYLNASPQPLQILTNTGKCYTLLTMLALESTDTFTTVTCLNLLFITIYMFSGCTYFLYWRGTSRAYNPQWFRLGGRASPDQYSHGHHPLKWIADTSSLHSQHGGYNIKNKTNDHLYSKNFYLWIELCMHIFVITLVCLSYHIHVLAPVICVDDMWLDSLCRWGLGQPSVWILWRGKSRPRDHWTSRSLLTWTMQSGSRINYSSVSRRVRSATFLWLDMVRALPSSQTHPSPHNSIWGQILGNPCREKSDEV